MDYKKKYIKYKKKYLNLKQVYGGAAVENIKIYKAFEYYVKTLKIGSKLKYKKVEYTLEEIKKEKFVNQYQPIEECTTKNLCTPVGFKKIYTYKNKNKNKKNCIHLWHIKFYTKKNNKIDQSKKNNIKDYFEIKIDDNNIKNEKNKFITIAKIDNDFKIDIKKRTDFLFEYNKKFLFVEAKYSGSLYNQIKDQTMENKLLKFINDPESRGFIVLKKEDNKNKYFLYPSPSNVYEKINDKSENIENYGFWNNKILCILGKKEKKKKKKKKEEEEEQILNISTLINTKIMDNNKLNKHLSMEFSLVINNKLKEHWSMKYSFFMEYSFVIEKRIYDDLYLIKYAKLSTGDYYYKYEDNKLIISNIQEISDDDYKYYSFETK
jgi:hypothetical protein